MSNYAFIGSTPRFYPEIMGPYGSLIAEPGDVVDFEANQPPTDGLWAESSLPATPYEKREWPPPAEVPGPAVPAEPGPPVMDFETAPPAVEVPAVPDQPVQANFDPHIG